MQLYSLPHEHKSEANHSRKEKKRKKKKKNLTDELFSTHVQPKQTTSIQMRMSLAEMKSNR